MASSDSSNYTYYRRLRVARSGERDPLNPHDWSPTLILPPAPRRFCDPDVAFGNPDATGNRWVTPVGSRSSVEWAAFRGAVLQHAICVEVGRRDQEQHGRLLTQLARLDGRSNARACWSAMLAGRRQMSLDDLALLLTHDPEVLPDWAGVATLLAAAEHQEPSADDWYDVRH